MARVLKVLLGIMLTVVCAEVAVRLAAPQLPDPAPWPSPEVRLKSSQMRSLECVDVVMLGTSVTEAAVVPELMGTGAYNAALPFGTFRSLALWYSDFVVPTLCHDRVVIGVPLWADGAADPDPLLAGLEAVIDYRDPDTLLDRIMGYSELARRRAQLKALGDQWTMAYRPERTGLIGPRGNQLGYANRGLGTFPDPADPTGHVEVDVAALTGLVSEIRGLGHTVLLMVEPAPCGPLGICPNQSDLDARRDIYEEAAQMMGVELVDLGLFFDPAEYADFSHLNESGARRFTAMLAAAIDADEQ